MEHINFGKFKRVNEAVHPDKLSPDELVALRNMRLDEELGIVTRRKGFSRFSKQAGTADFNNLWDIYTCNEENYLLANIGGILKKSLNGTADWKDVKTGLTPSRMSMSPFTIFFFFTNNNEKPFYTDTTEESDVVYDMELERPDISLVETDENVSGANNRWSIWALVYVTIDGQRSNPSNKMGLDYSYDTDPYNVTLTNIPVPTDERIISKYLYRTKEFDLTTFYLVTILDVDTTTYTDKTSDDDLDVTETLEYMNTPFKAKYNSANTDRVFLSNFTKYATNRVIPPEQYKNSTLVFVSDAAQSGNLLAGVYKYGISYVDRFGNESELIEYFSYTLADDNKKLIFATPVFPVTTYEDALDRTTFKSNLTIKFVRLYRTEKDGSTYYFLNDFENPILDTSYTDNTSDADLILNSEYPVWFNYEEELIERSAVVFSNSDKPLEIPELNLWEIYPDDGDEITGIFDDDNGQMIFKQRSICKLYTNAPPTNWYRKRLVENIGCDEPTSIYKLSNAYFFVYQKRPYFFDGQSRPKPIGESFKNTFDSVDSFLDATFWHKAQWYVLTVKIGTEYYLLCYDTKLDGWYKFSIYKADALAEGKYGAHKGYILIGGDDYVTYYDETKEVDSDSGSTTYIYPYLKTGNRVFPDNFVRARLMELFIDYIRYIGSQDEKCYFRLIDPETNQNKVLGDDDEETTINIFKCPTDGMDGTLKRCNKVNFSCFGEALNKFNTARLDYNPETWGNRRKTNIDTSGVGTNIGLSVGEN